jgi:polyisoprenoid-binding protein YceI
MDTSNTANVTANGTPPALPDGAWKIDPARSEIGFAVKSMGLITVRGVFREYGGSLTVRGGGAAGELTIEAASLDTRNKRRDKHLRSPDFFDVERHPRIVFTATAVTARNGGVTVTGDLGIGGARLPLELPVNVESAGSGAIRLEGMTTIPRAAAGLDWNLLGMVARDAMLHADLTLESTRPEPA